MVSGVHVDISNGAFEGKKDVAPKWPKRPKIPLE